MSKKMNFALVGCGRISSKHCEAVSKQLDTTRLVAVCDIDAAKARQVGEQYGAAWYTDYHAMMKAHPEVEVVTVLTPSGDHPKHVIDLAPYGKHIVVEKPMALTIPEAEAMISACDEAGVRLFVVKQNRYNLPVVKLRQALVAGRFGKLVMGTVRVRWCRTQAYYNQDSWRGTWAKDGGVLMNQASHHVDLLTWMMGDVESVFCYTATRLVKIETEDTAVAVLKFTNGALGVIEATTATRPKDLEGSLSVLGENGTVEIAGFAVNEMKTWNFKDENPDAASEAKGIKELPPNVYGFGHVAYLADVVHAIRANKNNAVAGIEGMKSLLLINAMYESMETGKEVKLLFRPKHVRLGT
jgi:UDP-N-acetyl-2-amino-2-deoxyglucuronate dehydrogenase